MRWRECSLRTRTFRQVQRQLVGAYFLQENQFEAAALFNPSIVLHPDQTGAPEGGCRFILSLRALGKGTFPHSRFARASSPPMAAIRIDPSRAARLGAQHTEAGSGARWGERGAHIHPGEDISERVIFPVTLAQSNGIEDARFVPSSDEGQKTFYATYTAYNGREISSELIETADFVSFRMSPLRGAAAQNKGMALFPRKIDGQYAMIGRQDNENLYLDPV